MDHVSDDACPCPVCRLGLGAYLLTQFEEAEEAGPCVVCGKPNHDDGSAITWTCKVCGCFVCRFCTLRMPNGIEIYWDTYCSRECWARDGSPDE